MTNKWMAVLALGLLAPAAFGQAVTMTERTAAPVQTLRSEIKRDKGDRIGKTKTQRAEHKQLVAQEKAELAKVGQSVGTRAEKKQARQAVRAKYAQLMKEERAKFAYEKKNLSEDISSKHHQIKKLRQS